MSNHPGRSKGGRFWAAERTTVLQLACASAASWAYLACETDTVPPSEMVVDDDSSKVVDTPECDEETLEHCDIECDEEHSCPKGKYCSDGACIFDCVEDTDCAEGICTPEGFCFAETMIVLDPPNIDPDPPKDGPACVEGEVRFEAAFPQVWLLLDRSGSMSSTLDSVSRWDALGRVLLGDPMVTDDRGVVGDLEGQVAFGATFYTSGSGSSGCILDLESVALASNSYSTIRQRYEKLGPTGGTPTADSVAAVVANADASDLTGGPKILVLATDGAPGGCSPGGGVATEDVENEVAQAFAKGIKTFAVSISTGTDAPHMQRVANLGVGQAADATPPAPYYTAENQDELKAAFTTILADVPRSCVFSLNGEVDREKADQGTVTLAGDELTYEDEDGWVLKTPTQVELVGAACDLIQEGEEDLEITFPCSAFTPTIR